MSGLQKVFTRLSPSLVSCEGNVRGPSEYPAQSLLFLGSHAPHPSGHHGRDLLGVPDRVPCTTKFCRCGRGRLRHGEPRPTRRDVGGGMAVTMMVAVAWAQGNQPAGSAGGTLSFFVPIILIFVVFYFVLILPQQKRQKKLKAMVDALKKGDK